MFNKTIAVIPARGGSKRIPHKNLVQLKKYPLIAYSIFVSRACKLIEDTIVYTEDHEIATTAFYYEAHIPFMRPKETAEDSSTDYDWICSFLEQYEKKYQEYPETLVLLRATTPLRHVSELERAISSFNRENSAMRSVERIPEAVEKTFKLTEDGLLRPQFDTMTIEDANKPNQSFLTSYKANGYIDILKPEFILTHKKLYGDKVQSFVTKSTIEIDEPQDLVYAEFILKNEQF